MSSDRPVRPPLRERSRDLSAQELMQIPWLKGLSDAERARTLHGLRIVEVEKGELLCRVGRPATYWFGVVEGLLKMSTQTASGVPMTFTGVPPGGWFGEGTLLKRESYRYNIQALRNSRVAGLSAETFYWLLDQSVAFNRFVLEQLNERLGQFIAAREIDRLSDPDVKVARSLSALFHPLLYPGVGEMLRITQQEMAYLVGLSRQRVNQSLRHLEDEGLIRVEYGGLRVIDLPGLRRRMVPAAD